ncbi:hypothetical protein WG899_18825 [Paucibacter sp. AS339]|uniref:hypothetical protein n=1 Tax=Paucibacter hankyongi TaxID=3133434 RepID=UPI0030958FEF
MLTSRLRAPNRPTRLALAALLLSLLAACAAPQEQTVRQSLVDPVGLKQADAWPPELAGLRAQALSLGQPPLTVDAAASSVRIHVFRAGRAARLGHNHVLSVPKLHGLVLAPPDASGSLEGAAFELSFRLDELELDAPAARAALGPGWASQLSAEAIAATRANMLGPAGLQAEAYPLVRLRSLEIRGAAPKLSVLLEIELHGQRRQQWLALHAEPQAQRLQARGALVLRQSDFGLTPFSVAGGLLAVQDELLIEFDLLAKP